MRQGSAFRSSVGAGTPHPPEAGRYHLYVSYACPWAHRVIIARTLKGLGGIVGMTAVGPLRGQHGWAFTHEPDPVNGWAYLSEGYRATDPEWSGRVTVPTLWDTRAGCIVNNESEDILRIFDSGFGPLASGSPVLRPAVIQPEIDAVNAVVYPLINNGVYRAGFATSQAAYEDAASDVSRGLTEVETILKRSRWLAGNRFTEADIRLFTTLVRFDPVYHTHFKCNERLIADSPTLCGFVRDVAQIPGVMETISTDEIKRHYYLTHSAINPVGIVPVSDGPDLAAPHGRTHLGPEALAGGPTA